jgi:exodeoxyribonuclease VII large subunit
VIVTAVDDYCTQLARIAHRLSTRTRGVCAGAGRRVTEVERRVRRGVPTAFDREHETLSRSSRRVRTAARRRVDEADGALVERQRVLVTAAVRAGRVGGRALDSAAARLRALDPRRVLERGYSLTRDAEARVVRSPADVDPGALLVTETAGGLIRSRREPEAQTVPVDRDDTTMGDET